MTTAEKHPAKALSSKDAKLDQLLADADGYYADAWSRALAEAQSERRSGGKWWRAAFRPAPRRPPR